MISEQLRFRVQYSRRVQKELCGRGRTWRGRVGPVRRFAVHRLWGLWKGGRHGRLVAEHGFETGGAEDSIVVQWADTEHCSSVDAALTQLTKHAICLVHRKHAVNRRLNLHKLIDSKTRLTESTEFYQCAWVNRSSHLYVNHNNNNNK